MNSKSLLKKRKKEKNGDLTRSKIESIIFMSWLTFYLTNTFVDVSLTSYNGFFNSNIEAETYV
jgi:hypothetical protein